MIWSSVLGKGCDAIAGYAPGTILNAVLGENPGTNKIIGLGTAGNILILLNLILNHPACKVYVDWYSKGNCIVFDKNYKEDFNIINPFDYYFEQLYKPHGNSISFNAKTFLSYANCNELNCGLYKKSKELFYSNFKLKPCLTDDIDAFYNKSFKGKNVLGIQVRVTDMLHYHLTPHGIGYFVDKARNIMLQRPVDAIFIATDSTVTINAFRTAFPNVDILYQKNISRSDKENDAVGPQDRIDYTFDNNNIRKYHNFLSGKEVLIDIFLLSKCNYFLRSHSSVSDVAIVLNDNIQELFV